MQDLPKYLIPKWAEGKKIIFDVGHNPSAIVSFILFSGRNDQVLSQKC